ncbi:MAG: DUF1571 domain-containing protein [Pirellulaceae bacterium]|nr:DUF1571 domain-containing protein [Pirellulaceae bacterium]
MFSPKGPKLSCAILCLTLFLTGNRSASGSENRATASSDGTQKAANRFAFEGLKTQHKQLLYHVIQMAELGLVKIDSEIHDYTCKLIRRERIGNQLGGYEHLDLKLRHERRQNDKIVVPFSVYAHFQKSPRFQGREVLYVAGRHQGDLIVKRGGPRLGGITLQLNPQGKLALSHNRYPITDIGIRNLVMKTLAVLQEEIAYDDCQVRMLKDSKLNGASCTQIELTHPTQRDHFRYHRAKVLIDDKLQIPIYFASYSWPQATDEEPLLLEEYAYLNVRLNVGLSEDDFQQSNPAYGFSKKSAER